MKLIFRLHVYVWYKPFEIEKSLATYIISTERNSSYPNMITRVSTRLAKFHDNDVQNKTWKSYPRLKKL